MTRSLWIPIFISLALFPALFTFFRFCLIIDGWELRDPVAGITTIAAGVRVARFELLRHGNIFWTSLKSFGVPLLANDVQAAILYPLTFLFIWLPEIYFWNVFVCTRTVLIGCFSYVLATRFLKLRPIGAWFFTLTFAYSLYVVRWLNHPWQNALLAGLAYLYFTTNLLNLSFVSQQKRWGKNVLGLILSCYSLVTAGFPEGSAMAGLLIALVLLPPLWIRLRQKQLPLKSFLLAVLFSHAIGFMLASPAFFALLEGVTLSGNQYREEFGKAQYGPSMYSLNLLSRFSDTAPPLQDPVFLNLIPFYLFLWGLIQTLKRPKKISVLDCSAFICFIFFVLKLFPVWPLFNNFVGSLPVLNKCWFTVYFMPIFLWFYSYFVARGSENVFYFDSLRPKSSLVKAFLLSTVILLAFIWVAIQTTNPNTFLIVKTGILYLFFCLLVFAALALRKKYIFSVSVLLALVSLLEVVNVHPHSFRPFEAEKYYFWELERGGDIANLLRKQDRSSLDMREDSAGGSYTRYGIATRDNGNPPILSYRLRELRKILFDSTDPEGYAPLTKEKYAYSKQIIGNNLSLYGAKEFTQLPKEKTKNSIPLGLVGDRYLLYDNSSLDRAYLASSCLVSDGWETSSKLLSNPNIFKLGKVIVEGMGANELDICKNTSTSVQKVSVASDTGTSVQISPLKGPGIFVLNDNFYPGWKVIDKVSHQTLPIFPANLTFRAVFLPDARTYHLEFMYEPTWLVVSKYMVLAGFLGVLLLLALVTRARTL